MINCKFSRIQYIYFTFKPQTHTTSARFACTLDSGARPPSARGLSLERLHSTQHIPWSFQEPRLHCSAAYEVSPSPPARLHSTRSPLASASRRGLLSPHGHHSVSSSWTPFPVQSLHLVPPRTPSQLQQRLLLQALSIQHPHVEHLHPQRSTIHQTDSVNAPDTTLPTMSSSGIETETYSTLILAADLASSLRAIHEPLAVLPNHSTTHPRSTLRSLKIELAWLT